jgi:hypothetical protein
LHRHDPELQPKLISQIQRGTRRVTKGGNIPAINWAHPTAQGLRAAFYPIINTSGTWLNLVGEINITVGTRTGGIKATQDGFGAGGFLSQTAGSSVVPTIWQTASASVFTRAQYLGAGGGTSGASIIYLANATDGSVSPFFAICIQNGTGGGMRCGWNNNNTTVAQGAVQTPTVNAMFSMGASVKANSQKQFYNGAQTDALTASTGIGYGSSPGIAINICGGGSSTLNCVTDVIYLWTRYLSEGEHLRLHVDPYCLLSWPGDEFAQPLGLLNFDQASAQMQVSGA